MFTHCSWVLVPFYGAKIQMFYASQNLSWNYHRFLNFTYCKVKFQSNFVVISQNFVNLFFVFFMRQNFMSISCYWKMKVVWDLNSCIATGLGGPLKDFLNHKFNCTTIESEGKFSAYWFEIFGSIMMIAKLWCLFVFVVTVHGYHVIYRAKRFVYKAIDTPT